MIILGLGIVAVILLIVFVLYNKEMILKITELIQDYFADKSPPNPKPKPPSPPPSKTKSYEKQLTDMKNMINTENINNNVQNNSNIKTNDENNADVDNEEDNIGNSTIHTNGQYCYVGKDKGYRSCIELADGDKCMSGDIFPSLDICINPNLRE